MIIGVSKIKTRKPLCVSRVVEFARFIVSALVRNIIILDFSSLTCLNVI